MYFQVIGDARNKIIQKKRLRFRDARDRLAEIAKQGDARDKINKNRKFSNAPQKVYIYNDITVLLFIPNSAII